MVEPSLSLIAYTYVTFALRLFVEMLKIHCWFVGSHRKAVSGVVESTTSLTWLTAVPLFLWMSWNDVTTPAVPTDLPLASQTMNFAGTVLPCLKTLEPSKLIGWRIVCPAEPRQLPLATYR